MGDCIALLASTVNTGCKAKEAAGGTVPCQSACVKQLLAADCLLKQQYQNHWALGVCLAMLSSSKYTEQGGQLAATLG